MKRLRSAPREPSVSSRTMNRQDRLNREAMRRLEGRVAVVTGAGGGIGAACAERMASEGARVVVADIDGDAATRVADQINGAVSTASATSCQVDVSSESDVERAIGHALRQFGRLDVLHNNAAQNARAASAGGEVAGGVTTVDIDQWDRNMAVTLRGTMLGCKHAIPAMMETDGGGSIINTSSTMALAADTAYPAYTAAKAGVIALTRHVATAYGRYGIRCNSVAPGPTLTRSLEGAYDEDLRKRVSNHITLGRLGAPGEIADVVLFLASEESAFVNGQVIVADGGSLIHQPWAEMHAS